MKKKSLILLSILFSLFIFEKTFSKAYFVGDIISNKIEVSKKLTVKLPEGEWEVVAKYVTSEYGLGLKGIILARAENNYVAEFFVISEFLLAGIYQAALNEAVYEITFKDKYDGCYERPEYYKLGLYKKGSAHNCLVIGHSEIKKDIYFPEDPESTFAQTKKWLKQTNYKLPPIMLGSSHSYFSRMTGGNLYTLGYLIDPLLLGAPESEFKTEETSEYHKHNIEKHLEHKKIMDEFVKISFQRHQEFEKIIKAKGFQKLKFEDLK